MRVLPKIFQRDFPILLCQIWCRRYKHMFGEDVPIFPQQVIVYEKGLLTAYRSPDVNKEINSILLSKIEKDPVFIENYLANYEEKFKTVAQLCTSHITNRIVFVEFIEHIFDCWQAHYISLYVPPDERFSEKDRKTAMSFRKKYDQLEYQSFNHLTSTLYALYGGTNARCLYMDEILNESLPSDLALRERRQQKLFIVDSVLTESKFEKLEKEFDFALESEADTTNISELKGQIACRGKVQGRVQLLLRAEDVPSFEEGRVLVSSMTVPTFLPAMNKAVAFVTDEGGITCHAAIVAREMKKPCIIGTKLATKLFRDGDLVEVDAEKGIVKKIG